MKILFLFLFVYVSFSFGGALADTGALPSWSQLHMTKKDYFFLSGLGGLICGALFTFLITR